ncbi:MAG: hypothetical protein GX780_02645 [Campylobacteraceae bacterium]|nr:hypothetical protein [Campylobacteraceae bacterium]
MSQLGDLTKAFISHTMHYNASLPISIDVLEKIGYLRYKLKVGHKEMTTKSMKTLKVGEKYWGNFSESKDGILAINNLRKKPTLMQKNENFLAIDSFDFLEYILDNKDPALSIKKWILKLLAECENKEIFYTLSSMLLALHEGIVHLPLSINRNIFLLQWRENQSLNDSLIDFYFAYENLGAIQGRVDSTTNSLNIQTLFERTANFLNRHSKDAPFTLQVETNDNLNPIWEGTHGLLDIKG